MAAPATSELLGYRSLGGSPPLARKPAAIEAALEQLQGTKLGPDNPIGSQKSISVISSTLSEGIPERVDFSNLEKFAEYLPTRTGLDAAHKVAKRVYETSSRVIGDAIYEYRMEPEIQAFLMKSVQAGGVVVEIGGATGENAVLLAFAGATKVVINDASKEEAARFQSLSKDVGGIPSVVSKKVEYVQGSCFDLLTQKPELKGTVDLVLCRNVIHLFADEELLKFQLLLKRLLKPGGKAVVTANSVYEYPGPEQKAFFEKNPLVDSFNMLIFSTKCPKTSRKIIVYTAFEPSLKKNSAEISVKLEIFTKREDGNWNKNETKLSSLSPLDQKQILDRFMTLGGAGSLNHLPAGTSFNVAVSKYRRLYNTQTLPALFEKGGFKVSYTFVADNLGHLITQGELFRGNLAVRDVTGAGAIGVILIKA